VLISVLTLFFVNIGEIINVKADDANAYIKYFYYTGSAQEFTVPTTGKYKIELWGASGGHNVTINVVIANEGEGGYTSGNIDLKANEKIYVYVGGQGTQASQTTTVNGGWNGGGKGMPADDVNDGGGSGGGATDIRYFKNSNPSSKELAWDNFEGLKSRIMVAAGGGGGATVDTSLNGVPNSAGTSGGLTGVGSVWRWQKVTVSGNYHATQTSGYAFGKGANGLTSHAGGSGGSGGYFTGSPSYESSTAGAAGGSSSFISGHEGCIAIDETSTESKIISKEDSEHYSGKVFTDTVMIDGEGYSWTTERTTKTGMPNTAGTGTEYGHTGNGYAKISYEELLSDNNYLRYIEVSDGELSPEFITTKYEYGVSVDAYTYEIHIEAEVYERRASVTGTGKHHLSLGVNEIPLTVTAPDGSIRIYTVNVTRNGLGYPSSELMQYNIDDAIYEVGQGETEFDINILSGVY
jgi:hypothetical protein